MKLRLLGEDLVAFRDTDGRLGVLGEYCPHRKASLVSGATRNAGCAASTTAGNSTWKATCWRWSPSRPRAASPPRSSTRPTRRAGGWRLRLGLYGPGGQDAGIRASALRADAGDQGEHRQDRSALQLGADHGGADRLGAQLEPALLRHAARAGRHAPRPPTRTGCGPRPTRPAHPGAAHQLRLALCRDPPADHERRAPTATCASPSLSRPSRH